MAYRLRAFQVQFIAEPTHYPAGTPCRSSEDVASVARSIYQTLDADKEHFLLLVMNNKNKVNGFKVISTGSLTASLVHPREVWRAALHLCAAAVIFVRNHPSGDPAPSPECVFRAKSTLIPLANRHPFRSKSALVPTQIDNSL